MRLGVTMPMVKQPLGQFGAMARAAEDAGFDSVWDYEVYENPFVVLATAAAATDRIQLGTGIAAALARSPFEMANAAVDVNELSGGRMALGVGLGIPVLMQTLHGAPVDHPVERMRDYLGALRAVNGYLTDAQPTEFRSEYTYFIGPPNPLGARLMDHDTPPVYLGAMNPRMARLAGELADGLIGGGYSAPFIRDVVWPNLEAGAKRAGRDPAQIDVVSQVVCCVCPDRAEAVRRARIHVGQLVSNPVQDGILAALGLTAAAQDARAALMTSGPAGLADVTADSLLDAFALYGTPDECRAQIKRFEGLVPHVMLHPPYVAPLTAEESLDGFHQILSAFGASA